MKKIHRAIRPATNPLEHYLYHISYIGEGMLIRILDMAIHLVDENSVVGKNVMPPNAIDNPTTLLAASTILVVDGVIHITDEQETIEGLSNEDEI